jgi:hypothetical protein
MQFRSAGDRHDPRLLGEQPGERDLGGRRALTLRDDLDQVDQSEVRLASLGREARHVVAEVGGIKLRVFIDLAGEETGPQRTERYESDTELL